MRPPAGRAGRAIPLHPLASLATVAKHLVNRYGPLGVLVGMIVESAGVPVPSEVIMPLGALWALGNGGIPALALIAALGTAGNLIGSAVAYVIGGAVGAGWPWLRRSHLETARRWFERYGDRAVLIGRVLPAVRTYISFPAGAAAMPRWRFVAYTVLGSALWSCALAAVGYALGQNWQRIVPFFHRFTEVTVAVAVLTLAAWWLLRRRGPARPQR